MTLRPPGVLVAVLLATSLAACSDSAETPSSPVTSSPAAVTTSPAEPPEQQVPVPGETVTVVFLQVAPAVEGDAVFDATIDRLRSLGYQVAPVDIACVEGGAQMLGVQDDPSSRGVALYFDSFATADTFSTLWSGDVLGFIDTTVCEQAAG